MCAVCSMCRYTRLLQSAGLIVQHHTRPFSDQLLYSVSSVIQTGHSHQMDETHGFNFPSSPLTSIVSLIQHMVLKRGEEEEERKGGEQFHCITNASLSRMYVCMYQCNSFCPEDFIIGENSEVSHVYQQITHCHNWDSYQEGQREVAAKILSLFDGVIHCIPAGKR